MGGLASDEKHDAAKKGKKGNASAPVAMSTADHTAFIDLLLQQAAQSGKAAATLTDPKELLHAAGKTVSRTRLALFSYTMPETGTTASKLFRSVDAAFMGLYDLYFALRDKQDPGASAYSEDVRAAMTELSDRFKPLGWKVPKSETEGHARAKKADRAGAAALTTTEKGKLGRLHLRAARQYMLGRWDQIVEGKLTGLSDAAVNLADALSILVDPHLAAEMEASATDVATTEQVFSRVVMAVEEHDAKKLGELGDVAKQLDALLRLVGKEPTWSARVGAKSAAPQNSPATASGSAPGTTTGTNTTEPNPSPGTTPATPAPPRAEPPMHEPVETKLYTRKVHIKDSNYIDEYLGYIELSMEAFKTAGGQVYVTRAKAKTHFTDDRARQYLSMGADVMAMSVRQNGQNFADVFFDIQIGGPNKTETSGVSVGAKATAANSDKSVGGEISASVTFSTAVSSQGTASFRRVFRISSLSKPMNVLQYDAGSGQLKLAEVGMLMAERGELHEDFSGFRLDDDDVGDEVLTFYADWTLKSYD